MDNIKIIDEVYPSRSREYENESPAMRSQSGRLKVKKVAIYDDYNSKMRTDETTCTITPNTGSKSNRNGQKVVYREPLKFKERNGKKVDGDYSFTIDSVNTGGVKVNSRIRRLTPTECERLQGFPDGWTEGISDSQRYRALGNAVSVPVVKAVVEKLL